jgi:hypothetical protein
MWSLTYILQSMGLTVICVALLTQVFCRLNQTELTNICYSSSGNLAEVVQTNWVGTPLTQSPHSVPSLKDLNWIMMACACCLKSIWLHSLTFYLGLTSWGKNLTTNLCWPVFFFFNKTGIWSVRGACPGLLIVIQSTERPWFLNVQSGVDDLLTLDMALPNN